MPADTEFLQSLGQGLHELRVSGQFCDAMVCVGSTRLLVHKLVLSAASKTLHDLALEFDMTPHRDRDQLEVIVPPDISLYAVNMFVKYLYTGQLELNERVVAHMERLATLFGVSHLLTQCQEYIQHRATPDSQNLNLQREDIHIEPDSSCTNGAQPASTEERSINQSQDGTGQMAQCRSRSGSGLEQTGSRERDLMAVKMEPIMDEPYSPEQLSEEKSRGIDTSKETLLQKKTSSMSVLEKLMSPVVNITKLPANITPDVVVLVSDDEMDDMDGNASVSSEPRTFKIKSSQVYTLEEKEAIALEARRFGTTQVSKSKNIPLQDILSWMTVFGLRHYVNPKTGKMGKLINQEGDLAIVRWVVQQQNTNGYVDLNCMKQFALSVYHQTQPKFVASKTWLGNFLQRNMSVLQGTRFVRGNERTVVNVYPEKEKAPVSGKDHSGSEAPHSPKAPSVKSVESVHPQSETGSFPLNEDVEDFSDDMPVDDDNDEYDDNEDSNFSEVLEPMPENMNSSFKTSTPDLSALATALNTPTQPATIQTPFGKRPIIIGQAKCFDAKSERKIVQWVLERNARDGYVFTDDFKDFARSLYKGSKPFGATQAWMKKFLRRNRALKDVKFCSKFKNTYSNEEKMAAVAMARRYGTAYAAKHTGISHKMVHTWRLAMDRGQLMPAASVMNRVNAMSFTASPIPTPSTGPSPGMPRSSSSSSVSSIVSNKPTQNMQALHGIVPEFETRIIQQMKEYQQQEGSINYDEISKMAQAVYKETRPTFKASYSWIRTFLDRHKEELKDIELEHVSKVLMEDDGGNEVSLDKSLIKPLSSDKITEMVDDALKNIDCDNSFTTDASGQILINPDQQGKERFTAERRPIIVGPSVTFNRKTEKRLVEWALERQARDGYVFTDDFKEFSKSIHQGPKHFSASSGWMSLFLRRHRELKHVLWKSKFKNNYTEAEKRAAVAEAKRLGTGHVGRKLGIDPALICAWRIKMDKDAQKHSFWKGTKIRKFGWAGRFNQPKFAPMKMDYGSESDAVRGIVPEFEQRIVQMILEEHQKEGSISYEEMSEISQSVYKETRPTFKASYAWLRSFMKRHEDKLANLTIENVKKIFLPEEEEVQSGDAHDFSAQKFFPRRPIIVGRSRSLDKKAEKLLVQWMVEQQEKNGYVFLDQFKAYAQTLYKGDKKFAATQAWRVKFLRRNHNAVKHVKFTSSFRNQYSLEEKRAIVLEAKRLGVAHVAKKTGIDHCLINSWRLKMEKAGEIPVDDVEMERGAAKTSSALLPNIHCEYLSHAKKVKNDVGPGLCSIRGIVPKFEKAIVRTIMEKMDNEGSVSYQDISNIARAVYKETRPNFKACYNWIKDFVKRNKKELRHVEIEHSKKILMEDDSGIEVLIPEDRIEDVDAYLNTSEDNFGMGNDDAGNQASGGGLQKESSPAVFIENAEDPNFETQMNKGPSTSGSNAAITSSLDIDTIVSRKPIIVGTPVHFNRKTERRLVEWLLQRQNTEGFVFTDDFREYARSQYTGPPHKFAATNAWINKFMRRNRLEKRIIFQSRLKGNNPKYEEKIVELILEQQEKEGSVSNDDIQRLTQLVYKDIRPNFRACYNWIRDFIKRHKDELAGVELENVKKFFIPDDDNEKDGILIRDIDPLMGLPLAESSGEYQRQSDLDLSGNFDSTNSHDSSWMDINDSMDELAYSHSQTAQDSNPSSSDVLNKLVNRKRPIIIAPPKVLDIKTEKKLVHWMREQQRENGCVYLDLFKEYAKSIHTGPKRFAATQAWMMRFKQRNHAALKDINIRSRFRNEYSIEEKMAAVEEARRLGCHHVGRKLGINGGVIYSWKVQLEQAEKFGTGLGGAFMSEPERSLRGVVPEFEQTIVEMVLDVQRTKGSVSYDEVSQCARSVYQETRPQFKASYNWVVEFIRKNKDAFEDVNFENKRKATTEEEKLHILSEEKKYGTEHVVKKRNISASTIYHWKKAMQAKSIPIPKYKDLVGSKIKKKYAKGKKTQKTYTMEEKRKIVSVAEANGITHTSLKLGVSRNMIAKWVKHFRMQGENIVINFTHSATQKKELEQKVSSWVLQENDELGIVMTNRIQAHAKKIFEEAFTNYNATDYWLEGFIAQNAEKFENVRFREKGDTDLEFTDEVKIKLCRYAEKHGAVETADKTGLSPKHVYHWRRVLRQKGVDFTSAEPYTHSTPTPTIHTEPKSLMQQKLDRIEQKYSLVEQTRISEEAAINGTSSTASRYKIPLPLILKWMKMQSSFSGKGQGQSMPKSVDGMSSKESTPDSRSFSDSRIRSPSSEKNKMVTHMNKYSEEFKRELCKEAKSLGVMETSRKRGIPNSTLYGWFKEFERETSTGSNRKSTERSRSSFEGSRSSFGSRSSMESDKDVACTQRVENIKREPDEEANTGGYFSGSNAAQLYSSAFPSYKPRKYSDQEKADIVKRAMEIGVKPAADELDIPLSNVRRWTEMHKAKLKKTEVYLRKKERHREIREARVLEQQNELAGNGAPANSSPANKPASTVANREIGSGYSESERNATSFNLSGTEGIEAGKRKLAMDIDSEKFKRRRNSSLISEEEKMAFVRESQSKGARVTAINAGVSVDVVYKWRQKYLHRAFQSKPASKDTTNLSTSDVESSSNTSEILKRIKVEATDSGDLSSVDEPEQISTNTESQHSIDDTLVSPNGEVIGTETVDNLSRTPIVDDISKSPVSALEDLVEESDNVVGASDVSDKILPEDIPPMEHFMQTSAASHILEMTESYIENEKAHENATNQIRQDISLNLNKHGDSQQLVAGVGVMNEELDCEIMLNDDFDADSVNEDLSDGENTKTDSIEAEASESNLENIQIVNVKSEVSLD